MLDILKIAVLGHVDGRMGPVPCVVGPVVAVEHIVAGILQVLCRPLGFRHIAPDLGVFLPRQSALAEAFRLGDDAVAQRYREVLAAGLLDGLNDLDGEAIPVLERTAIFVVATIDVGQRELIEQIPLVHRVDLDAVDARLLQQHRATAERVDHLVNLLDGHLARGNLVRPSVRRGACRRANAVKVHERF